MNGGNCYEQGIGCILFNFGVILVLEYGSFLLNSSYLGFGLFDSTV
ncbi:MAG: hypothetical protein IJ740_18235 [Ruminococcus sp.]|nr:hypothetical protein [Ruminococcus sp.]